MVRGIKTLLIVTKYYINALINNKITMDNYPLTTDHGPLTTNYGPLTMNHEQLTTTNN